MADDDALALARACVAHMMARDAASRALGMRVDVPAPGHAVVRMTVGDALVNGFDICHGGYLFTLADSAFAFACNGYDRVTVSAGAQIDFLAPARRGDRLVATASEVHRGRRVGLYDVRIAREDGTPLAVFRGQCVVRREAILET